MELLSILFPKKCVICQKILENPKEHICGKCAKKVQWIQSPTCYSCGKQLEFDDQELCYDCRKHPKTFKKGKALCYYNDEIRQSLSAIKYHNQREFANFYIEEIRKREKELRGWKVDMILPVPMHPLKRRRRGFNQASLFARGIGKVLRKPVNESFLIRTSYTTPQKKLGPMERTRNLEKAFAVSKRAIAKIGIPRSVLLVDDIYTTGATVESCARVLKAAGVKEIYVYCIAIGRDA